MDPNLLNTILLIVLAVILFISFLGGLIGFAKGVYKTTLKTIVKAVLVIVLVFITPALANAIGSINLQPILQTANVTTIHSFIAQKLTETGLFSPINGLSLYASAIALANSILAYATFFVGAILIQIIASPLTALLYHGIFRWIIPVETNKERKLRKKNKKDSSLKEGLKDENGKVSQNPKKKWHLLKWPGFFIGALQELVMVFIILTPFTALATTAIKNKQGVQDVMDTMGMKEQDKTMVTSYMETVEKSPLYSMISALGYDLVIMDKASTVNLNGTPVSLNGLIDSVFDVADPLLKNGSFSYDAGAGVVTINLSYLLSLSTVDALVGKLVANPMVLALVPPVVDMAMNSLSGNSFAIDELDFNNIKWSSELEIVQSIYDAIYATSIEPMIQDNEFKVDQFKLETSKFTDQQIETYCQALRNLGSMESLQRNLPAVLSAAGVYLNSIGYSIFPTDSSVYKDVDWKEEFYDFGKILFHFLRTVKMDITPDFSSLTLSDNLINILHEEEKRNELQKYFCGDDNFHGLLDTQLFDCISFPDVLASSLSIVPALQSYIKEIDLNNVLNGYQTQDYKEELGTVFDMLGMLYSDDSKLNLENMASIDLMDNETVSQLADLLDKSKDSKIFSSIYPSIMKTFLFENQFDFSDYLFGLTPYNFNYDSKGFISDFVSLLRLLPKIQELQNTLSDDSLSLADKFNSFDSSIIKDLLTIVTQSDFFNSDVMTGMTSTRQKNVNIYTFLTNLFSTSVFENFTITVPSIHELQDIVWLDQGSNKGEISILCDLIDEIKKNSEFIGSSSHDIKNIEDTSAISNIIKSAMNSKILAPSVLELIDSSLGRYLDDMGIHMSLNEIRTSVWIEDADRIGKLLGLLQGIDFNDLEHLPIDRFNAILTNLYHCEFLKESNHYNDRFGYLVYNMIKSQDLSGKMSMQMPDISCFDVVGHGKSWSSLTENKEITRVISDTVSYTDTYEITIEGEIAYLSDFLSIVLDKERGFGFDNIKGGKLPEGFVDSISDLMPSYIIRNLLSNFISEIVGQISFNEVFEDILSSVDFTLFRTLSDEDAKTELKFLECLYQFNVQQYEGTTKLKYVTEHIYELQDKDLMEDFMELMDYIKYSKLMNTKRAGYSMVPIGYFYYGLFRANHLMEQITLYSDSDIREYAFKGILLEVDDYAEEIERLKRIVELLQGQSDSNFSLGTNLDYQKSHDIMAEMNASQIFHRFPIYLLKKAIQERGIEDYLVDPATGDVSHPLNWEAHLGVEQEDIEYWQNDIDHLLEMMLGEHGLISIFTSSGSSFDDIDVTNDDFHFDFFYHIGSTNLFKESRSYLLYNLIQKQSQDDFDISNILQTATTAPYGENKSVYRLEELYFQNPKLVDSNGLLIKEKALNDTDMLKKVISTILKNISTVSSLTDLKNLNIDFEALNNATISFTDGVNTNQFYRSDIASEFVAGLQNQLIHNNYLTYFFSGLSGMDFYKLDDGTNTYPYFFVNPIEGRALNAIIGISKLDLTATYQKVADLTPIFDKLGVEQALIDNETITVTSKEKVTYFLSDPYYATSGNSYIGLKEYQLLSYVRVKVVATGEIKFIPDVITDFNDTTLASNSFASLLRDVADTLE